MIMKISHRHFQSLLLATLAIAFAISLAPVRAAYADTSTSDIAIEIVSAPRHAKSCETFEVTFRVTNLGPDAATSLFVFASTPDQLGTLDILGVPETLAAGESVIITAVVKVVAFGPNDPRNVWIGGGASSQPYPDTSVDPNPENNNVSQPLKLVGKARGVCP
jgi:hypothetical protein